MDENQIWAIRAFIYRCFAEATRPPSIDETAAHFSLTDGQSAAAYEELQRHHTILLAPGTHDIQMAWPFSGMNTPFQVRANGKTYFANCAWDSLGIPAALHADAEIEAVGAQSGDRIQFIVTGQQVNGSDALVHFLVPFQNWYDDLAFT
jgi:hypothetical protein